LPAYFDFGRAVRQVTKLRRNKHTGHGAILSRGGAEE
jgi:hypothetical protein